MLQQLLYKLIYNSMFIRKLREEIRKERAGYYQELFSKYKIKKILDLGCGTGSFWRWIDSKSLKLIGADIKFSRQLYPFKGIYADATNLPFKNNFFDCVFTNSVIEHIPETKQPIMLEEMLRVGKIVILQSPNRYFPIEQHTCLPFLGFFPTPFINWYLKRMKRSQLWIFSKSKLLNLICKHGEIIEFRKEKKWGFTKGYIVTFASRNQNYASCFVHC